MRMAPIKCSILVRPSVLRYNIAGKINRTKGALMFVTTLIQKLISPVSEIKTIAMYDIAMPTVAHTTVGNSADLVTILIKTKRTGFNATGHVYIIIMSRATREIVFRASSS